MGEAKARTTGKDVRQRIMGILHHQYPEPIKLARLQALTSLDETDLIKELVTLVQTGRVNVSGLRDQDKEPNVLLMLLQRKDYVSRMTFLISGAGRIEVDDQKTKAAGATAPKPRWQKTAASPGKAKDLLREGFRYQANAHQDQHRDPPAAAQAAQLAIEFAAKSLLAAAGIEWNEHDVSEALRSNASRLQGDAASVESVRRAWARVGLLNRMTAPLSEAGRYGFGGASAREVADVIPLPAMVEAATGALVLTRAALTEFERGRAKFA